jgi:maltose alpha-D-glucosyltransferase/alpha-amylase
MSTYWWKTAKIYELYIDKFAGDLQGLISHLPYFNQLGITCLHLLPHFPSPMVDDGYDITDYRGVRSELGNIEDFKKFLSEAHTHGLRVIIDFVLNHTSDQHPWFLEASSSKNNPKRDFYLWRDIAYGFEGSTNAFPDIKQSNWIPNKKTEDFYFATFYPQQPDLNWDNKEVQKEMLANMFFWAEMGVDGFRLDAAPYLIKRENSSSKGLPETHEVVKHIRKQIEQKYPDVILLAEAHQSVALTKQYFGDGDECHMAYHFPLMEQMWLSLMDHDKSGVEKVIAESFDIPDNCQWATFLRNHDEISLATLSPDDRIRLVDFLDPKYEYLFKKAKATSMRVASVFGGDREKIESAFELLYGTPGAPIMYYGDEIGMRNLPHHDSVIDTRRYVRGQFDWEEAKAQMKDPDSLFNKSAQIIKRVTTQVFLETN